MYKAWDSYIAACGMHMLHSHSSDTYVYLFTIVSTEEAVKSSKLQYPIRT